MFLKDQSLYTFQLWSSVQWWNQKFLKCHRVVQQWKTQQTINLEYNRARQAAITQEISEIVGGSEAQ
ncbi:hypothetical protein C4B25_04715 [Mycoplasma todarodis]|uniref:Uncharacterized protein n=1 Tax=Mycoplasma todarodis TaxID=1937191 RepID=A0A4R0XMY5_9MOLU|nr:hypothetical protein C4B25_04715 [Mycoplasma todarodis]